MNKLVIIILFSSFVFLSSCVKYYFKKNYKDTNEMLYLNKKDADFLFLKAHLNNGDICIFADHWKIDTTKQILSGFCSKFDFNRSLNSEDFMNIPLDEIAIIETNDLTLNPHTRIQNNLIILFSANLAGFIYCRMNPKACYGSCPTFYLNDVENNIHSADAEGFTNSITPSLEYADIDALMNVKINDNKLNLYLKNEALETHYIKQVKLLACPIKENQRVFHTNNDKYYLTENNYSILQTNETNELIELLEYDDKQEYFSLTDENNLKSKEELIFEFDNIDDYNNLALVLNFRQSLLTTYMFYSALSYMGIFSSDMFYLLETNEEIRNKFDSSIKELGGVDVFVFDENQNKWIYQDSFNETGPIAINKQIMPISNYLRNEKIKIKLELNKGLWRLDQLYLTNMIEEVKPKEIELSNVFNSSNHIESEVKNKLNDETKYLINSPGVQYKLEFNFTENGSYDLFLYSKGFYIEWIRPEWREETNISKLKEMINEPLNYLRNEANSYKEYEKIMEENFWNSRINNKSIIYNEK